MPKGKKAKKDKAVEPPVLSEPISERVLFAAPISFQSNKLYNPPTHHQLTRYELYNGVYCIDNFMLEKECRKMIEWGERNEFEELKQEEVNYYAFRDNGRYRVHNPLMAEAIFARLEPFLPNNSKAFEGMKCLGCSSDIRFYRYKTGQRFGKHVDESTQDDEKGGITKYTVLIYLNGTGISSATIPPPSHSYSERIKDLEDEEVPLVGGETVFHVGAYYGSRVVAEAIPLPGRLLFHGHGAECITHESRVVLAGTKYVLRTDVVYGKA